MADSWYDNVFRMNNIWDAGSVPKGGYNKLYI